MAAGISRGQVTEIYGPPGVGKTALAYVTDSFLVILTILFASILPVLMPGAGKLLKRCLEPVHRYALALYTLEEQSFGLVSVAFLSLSLDHTLKVGQA